MENRGFFTSLFDLSFTEFVTTRVIKVLFLLAIAAHAIAALAMLIGTFSRGFLNGLLGLIVVPITILISILLTRIWLEVIIVLFRIAENTGRLVQQGQGQTVENTDALQP